MSEAATTTSAPAEAAPEAASEPKTYSQDYVESLRAEAAKHRTDKNTAVDAAKAALIKDYEVKVAEKDTAFADLQTAHTDVSTELLKLKSAIAAGISVDDIEDVVALVQGTDEESVAKSVERVKTLIGKAPAKVSATDPTQGSGTAVPLNGNPVLDILKRAVGA